MKHLLILLVIFSTPDVNCFFGDLPETPPLHFVSGKCYFYSPEGYNAGEMEVIVKVNEPTIDLYSSEYLMLKRLFHGQSYKITNINRIPSGRVVVSYTIVFVGLPFPTPKSWCENVSLPKRGPTTRLPKRGPTPKPMYMKPNTKYLSEQESEDSLQSITPNPLPFVPSQPHLSPYNQPNEESDVLNRLHGIPNSPYNEPNEPHGERHQPYSVPKRPYIVPKPPSMGIPQPAIANPPTIIPSKPPYIFSNHPRTTPQPRLLPPIPNRPGLA